MELNTQQRTSAANTADKLLVSAFASSERVDITHEAGPAAAILIAAHALIAKLDAIETSHREAMRDLQESLDFLGAQPEGDEPTLRPTDHEREVIYRALEEDYLQNHKAESIGQMDAMLRRFKLLAGC